MENYTRIIGAGSTNIRTPTDPEITQGNNQLTPFDSAKNNGYSNEMSQQIGNISAELVNLISGAGLTPDSTLTQVLQSINKIVAQNAGSSVTIANNVSDANNDINFSAGNFEFSDGSGRAQISALTKELDVAWAAGNNQGGLFSGSKAANTWYHCFCIYNPTTGISDAGFDTSITAANAPSGFTKYKRVGSIRTDGSGNILAFNQYGNRFVLSTPISDLTGVANTSTATLRTITTPLGVKTIALVSVMTMSGNDSTTYTLISSPDNSDTPPSITLANSLGGNETFLYLSFSNLQIATNTNSQIRSRGFLEGGVNIGTLNLMTSGWLDYQL